MPHSCPIWSPTCGDSVHASDGGSWHPTALVSVVGVNSRGGFVIGSGCDTGARDRPRAVYARDCCRCALGNAAGAALDPMVALATSVHVSPGVYALLRCPT